MKYCMGTSATLNIRRVHVDCWDGGFVVEEGRRLWTCCIVGSRCGMRFCARGSFQRAIEGRRGQGRTIYFLLGRSCSTWQGNAAVEPPQNLAPPGESPLDFSFGDRLDGPLPFEIRTRSVAAPLLRHFQSAWPDAENCASTRASVHTASVRRSVVKVMHPDSVHWLHQGLVDRA